jgi:hypothetical protein
MKIKRLLSLALFLISMLFGTEAFAICLPFPTTGDDTIICTGSQTDVITDTGNDHITVETGTTLRSISSDAGDDTIINNGSISQDIYAGIGSDLIVNNGTVELTLDGDSRAFSGGGDDTIINNGTTMEIRADTSLYEGNDVVINNGTVFRNIHVGVGDALNVSPGPSNDIVVNNGMVGGIIAVYLGDDTVTLGGNANGGEDHYLWIQGGLGYDTLILAYDDPAVDEAVAANASSGSITVNGQTFEWTDFEQIVKGDPQGNDGRLNGGIEDNGRTAAVYCSYYEDGGVIVYGIDENAEGYLLFSVSSEDAHAALQEAHDTNEHVMIAEEDGQSLWALTSNELQIHDADGLYDFIFAPTVCGIPLAS